MPFAAILVANCDHVESVVADLAAVEIDLDAVALGQGDGVQQRVLELADVARPQISDEPLERGRGEVDLAIAGAGVNDIVLLAGKGHEPYQEVAGIRTPFSDADQARAALALRRECPRVVA